MWNCYHGGNIYWYLFKLYFTQVCCLAPINNIKTLNVQLELFMSSYLLMHQLPFLGQLTVTLSTTSSARFIAT